MKELQKIKITMVKTYSDFETILEKTIREEIKKYKNDKFNFFSGMGIYFFDKNGINVDDNELPKKLLKIIKFIDEMVDQYNFYPAFNVKSEE